MKTPRSGSKTEAALAYIAKKGCARTVELERDLDLGKGSASVLLKPYVEDGQLVACKVEVPGTPPQTEYRISGGGKPTPWKEIAVSPHRPPRPPETPVAESLAKPAEKATPAPAPEAATGETVPLTVKGHASGLAPIVVRGPGEAAQLALQAAILSAPPHPTPASESAPLTADQWVAAAIRAGASAQGLADEVTAPVAKAAEAVATRFCLWDDGSVEIVGDEAMIRIPPAAAERLWRLIDPKFSGAY